MLQLAGNAYGPSFDSYYYVKNSSTTTRRSTRRKHRQRIDVNVSGTMYTTYQTTLDRYPNSLLGKQRDKLTRDADGSIFFNRNRAAFIAILFFYQSRGCLARPETVPMEQFVKECRFFKLPEKSIYSMKTNDGYLYGNNKKRNQKRASRFRRWVWMFLEEPKKNLVSYVYFLLSYLIIIASIAVSCIDSLKLNIGTEYKLIELGLHIFFAIEFFVRFLAYPVRKEFLTKSLSIIDAISIFGFLCLYSIPMEFPGKELATNLTRLLRVLRLGNARKMSHSVHVALSVFKHSLHDVAAVIHCTLIITIFCGSLMYYVERPVQHTQFTSIPQSMWWALQTIVCLGYGDIVPAHAPGKLAAAPIMFLGVIAVTVLLLSLGGRFFETYSNELYQCGFLPKKSTRRHNSLRNY